MFPTYRNGQIKVGNKLAYMKHDPQRGDVVAVEYAGKQVLLLKRVIAVPGETVQVVKGEILINNRPIEEPYARGKIPASSGNRPGYTDPIPLGADEYMILGDNRELSEGYINKRPQILGKVL